jgi:sulfonate transport system substrate-binding protein
MAIFINRSWATSTIIAATIAGVMGVAGCAKNLNSKQHQNKKPPH